ncbi:MAG: lysine--tRNA ligase, partial [Gemmatimonadetes bacterium]
MTSFVEAARREKLAELVKRGVAPFAYRFDRSGAIAPALEGFRDDDATVHRLAGRLILLRPMGKTTFGHLEDRSGKIQLYFKVDDLGAEQYEVVKL